MTAQQITPRLDVGTPNRGWLLALLGSLVVAVLASSTPVLSAGFRSLVMNLFSGVCHQIPGRSPTINGVQLAICHRCFGIYWTIPMATVAFRLLRGNWPFRGRQAFLVLMASGIPAFIDWTGGLVGWWYNTPVSRMVTGGFLGLVVGYFLTKAVSEGIEQRNRARKEWDPVGEGQ